MKNVLRSTFGTLVVAFFLAIKPPIYARGGHGGGHGGHPGHPGGHAVRGHAAAGHLGAGTLVSVLAVHVVTMLRVPRAERALCRSGIQSERRP